MTSAVSRIMLLQLGVDVCAIAQPGRISGANPVFGTIIGGIYSGMKEPNEATHLALMGRLRIDPGSDLPKGRQLYLNLYEAISQGVPGRGALLPPTRLLAQHLGVGRNTVTQVYEQLASEGLVEGRGRAGTRVVFAGAASPAPRAAPALAPAAQQLGELNRPVALSPGEPDASLFPQRHWARALARAARASCERWGYVRDAGHPALRESITRFLAQYRGLRVGPEQVVVTAGTRQSLILAAGLYGSPGDVAWVEEPGYQGAVAAWRAHGLKLTPCAVDASGLRLPGGPDPKLVYTTPCFHYPLGATLAVERRRQLLQRAADSGAVVFEDDYDSEFRDQGQPRPALASEAASTVLHAGTFSKLMFPSVRVAWLVLPQGHVPAACRQLANIGGGHNAVTQAAVAQLLDDGVVARHLSRARQVYAQRKAVMLQSLDRHPDLLSYRPGSGGLNLVVDLRSAVPRQALEAELLERGLGGQPLESLHWSREPVARCQALVLGLGNVASLQIPETVDRLVGALRALR